MYILQRVLWHCLIESTVTISKYKVYIAEEKEDWKRSREEAARQRKRANDLKKTEKEISRLEEENDQLKEEMALPENATNVAKLMELNTKLEENEAALLELYDKWEELSE